MGTAQNGGALTEAVFRGNTCFIATDHGPVPQCVRNIRQHLPSAHVAELPTAAALQAPVLIAFAPTAHQYGRITHEIRRRPGLFLKPLLMLCSEKNGRWDCCVDGEHLVPPEPSAFAETLRRLRSIGEHINGYPPLHHYTRIRWLQEMLLLRYMDSRPADQMSPVSNVNLPRGYDYPLAAALAGGPAGRGHKLLESLRRDGLATGTVVDQLHVCPDCGDFRLNYREACPYCSSLTFAEEPIFRHSGCSHMGPKSDFETDRGLLCPRCRNRLREEGLDYETRWRHYWCRDCGRRFAEPGKEYRCLNCHTTTGPSETEVHSYRTYHITRDGEHAARRGSYPEAHLTDLVWEDPGLYNPEAFERFYRLEVARCRRYKVPASLATLSIGNLEKIIYGSKEADTRQRTSSTKNVLAGIFGETDLVTDVSRDELLIIFTHTPLEKARQELQRLQENLENLAGHPVDVHTRLFDLRRRSPALSELKKAAT